MNMLGIIEPADSHVVDREPLSTRVVDWLRVKRMFLLVVALPTLLIAGYLFLFASDQYESEAHFMVHSSETPTAASGGLGSLLSSATGIGAGASNGAMSVADYLTSHDAVAALRRDDRLVERFHDAGADLVSRLRTADPAPETLLRYYRKQIKVKYDSETGITTLTVHSFTPQDSFELTRKLLQLGEQRVNILNRRSYHDAIDMAQQQVVEAEQDIERNTRRMTNFRQNRSDIDPTAQGQSQITLVSQLSVQLASARAQLELMGKLVSHSSPQYTALVSRAQALEAQVEAQRARLTGPTTAIANDIDSFDNLKARQEFLGKQYEAAAVALQTARDTAQRQQLYIVRVVEPNMPVKALFPQRWRILGTVFVVLLLLYSIGWLIAAGVREHTN